VLRKNWFMKDPQLFEGALEGAQAESKSPKQRGRARVQHADRQQMQLQPVSLNDLLPADHRARLVWDWTGHLNLAPMYEAIGSQESGPGRPAIDPRILLSLWLFATLEGVGSARALDRLCSEHVAYRWICGGVGVNRDALAAFRREHEEDLDDVLTQSVASMISEGLVPLACVAQDGMRVRASAGTKSLRRRERLKTLERAARKHVKALKRELERDPAAASHREQGARMRAARERQKRVQQALKASKELEAEREKLRPCMRRRYFRNPVSVSTTDPEARMMRMGNGGFNVAYNAQLATDVDTQVIVGVELLSAPTDARQLAPMAEQVLERYGRLPEKWLADAGYTYHRDIERLHGSVEIYAPPQRFSKTEDPCTPRPNDSEAIVSWKRRMASAAGQAMYRKRLPAAEGVNALARNRGLQQFPVRGRKRARSALLIYVLAHNMNRSWNLRAA